MKKVVFIATILLMLLIASVAIAETRLRLVYNAESNDVDHLGEIFERTSSTNVEFLSTPKGKKIIFSAEWSDESNEWIATITEGAEFFKTSPFFSLGTQNRFTDITWEYVFNGDEKNKSELKIHTEKIVPTQTYILTTYMINLKGEVAYIVVSKVGRASSYNLAYNHFSDLFTFFDSPLITITGKGVFPSIACMLIDYVHNPTDGKYYPPVDKSWISEILNTDSSGGVYISKELAKALQDKETLLLPSSEKDFIISLKNISVEDDVILYGEDITVITK